MYRLVIAVALFAFLFSWRGHAFDLDASATGRRLFDIQSIDTMKYSRDMAEQTLDDPSGFKAMIRDEMSRIAETGATHAAIGTPYDARFLPVLRLWIASARAHNLSVWFRGNFSGWEEWFGYAKIDRAEHKRLLKEFLRNNPDLFQDNDVFSPCPECENGGPGDPRQTGDADGYNAFLREEKEMADGEFALQGKQIAVYPSMNGDVAREILAPATVSALKGTVLIDHYVRTPEQFARDLQEISRQLNAAVGLGEFGAPIPDLNGPMTQAEQAEYIDALFKVLYLQRARIPAVNYWVLRGGSTALLNANGTPRSVYATVRNYFKAFNAYGAVYNSIGENVNGIRARIPGADYATISDGIYQIFVPRQYGSLVIEADGYTSVTLRMPASATTTDIRQDVRLEPIKPTWWYTIRAYLYGRARTWAPEWVQNRGKAS